MALYTERHGMRTPIERTSTITVEMYSLLFDCCEKYYDNIAWKFPEQCPDGQGCCGLDFQQFSIHMKFDIPTLYGIRRGASQSRTAATMEIQMNMTSSPCWT